MPDQYTFVYHCQTGALDAVRESLAAGAPIDEPDFLGRTALARASAGGHLECVRLLLDAGADPNTVETGTSISNESCPPLVAAAGEGHVEIVRVLLEVGVQLELRSSRYRTALAAAAEREQLEIMDMLIAAGASLDARQGFHDRSALASAAYLKCTRAILRLLAAGASPMVLSEDGDDALHVYCGSVMGRCEPDIVRVLLAAGVPVDELGASARTALHGAARWNGHEIVAVLLAAGADPNLRDAKGRTPLHGACEAMEGDAVIPLLLAAHAEVDVADDERNHPLHLACKNARVGDAALRALLAAGARVDVLGQYDCLPLELVFYSPDARTAAKAHALLEHGADCGALLERAARLGDAGLLEAFIAAGARLDTVDRYQRSPLHWAAFDGNAAVIEPLVRAGAKLDAADDDGHTPLHHALRQQKLDTAVALLRAGAGLLGNHRGHSPLHYAHADTLAALLQRLPELSEALAAEQQDARHALRCGARAGAARACDACAWQPSGEQALHCPWCGKQAVEISDYEVLSGNPEIPTPNTEVRFGYTCRHCGLVFANHWNAMNTSSPYLYEVEAGAAWESQDGGHSWRRRWGFRD